jgi:hypothetical protein
VQGTKVANMRLFSDVMPDGIKCGPDGMRADVSAAQRKGGYAFDCWEARARRVTPKNRGPDRKSAAFPLQTGLRSPG